MAFVPVTPLASSAFTGSRVASTCSVVRPGNTVVAALGRGTGQLNTSLDKLGLHKPMNESFAVRDGGRPAGFSADYEEIINGAYRQIFGNAYIMESERAEMATLESQFRDGSLNVKDFCRGLAKTHQYRRRFFDGRPLYGAIELNFKHFLGRTPDGLEQYRAKSGVYDSLGYDKFIDSFFDCGEYDAAYGDSTVPSIRGHLTTTRMSMSSFTHMSQLYRGPAVSDKSNPRTLTNKITLNRAGIQSIPISISYPGSVGGGFMASGPGFASGQSGASMARTSHGARRGDGGMFRIEVTSMSQAGASNGSVGLRSRTGKFYMRRNNSATKLSDSRMANQVFLVPFSQLSTTYMRIHKMGGKIASIQTV
jgi:phycoerythrin-associated linker protein